MSRATLLAPPAGHVEVPVFLTTTVNHCVWPADHFAGTPLRSNPPDQLAAPTVTATGCASANQRFWFWNISASRCMAPDATGAVTFIGIWAVWPGATSAVSRKTWLVRHDPIAAAPPGTAEKCMSRAT